MCKTLILLPLLVSFANLNRAAPAPGQRPTDLRTCFPFLYASKPQDIFKTLLSNWTLPKPTQLTRHYVIPNAEFEKFFLAALGGKCRSTSDLRSNELVMEEDATWDPSCEKFIPEARKQMEGNFVYRWTKAGNKYAREHLLTEKCPDNAIQNYFLWLPGNIFLGPKPVYRTDEPGRKFETGARFLLSKGDYEDLVYLNTTMPEYVKGTDFEGRPMGEVEKEALLEKIIVALEKVQEKSPHPYDIKQWVADQEIFRKIKTDRD